MADCIGVHVPEQDMAACMRAYAQSTAHARVRNCRDHMRSVTQDISRRSGYSVHALQDVLEYPIRTGLG